MIEFIGNNIRDISYWLMFLATLCAYILLYYQKKAYKELNEIRFGLTKELLGTETEYRDLIYAVKEFIDRHNEWHDRKISFYYDQNGWHCCYDDEMPQGDTFTTEEEITPQNENDSQLPTSKGMSL